MASRAPARNRAAGSVFDYPRQAVLYQPPLPAYNYRNADAFYDAVAGEIERLLEVNRGRTLCLFTNWSGSGSTIACKAASVASSGGPCAGRRATRCAAGLVPRRRLQRPPGDTLVLGGRRHPQRRAEPGDHGQDAFPRPATRYGARMQTIDAEGAQVSRSTWCR